MKFSNLDFRFSISNRWLASAGTIFAVIALAAIGR
jgi:hypothetical protein